LDSLAPMLSLNSAAASCSFTLHPLPLKSSIHLERAVCSQTRFVQGGVINSNFLESPFVGCVATFGLLRGGLTAAAIVLDGKLFDTTWGSSQRVLNANVMGAFWTAKLLPRHLVENKFPGRISVITSLSGRGLHVICWMFDQMLQLSRFGAVLTF
jgi:hypothetical protein